MKRNSAPHPAKIAVIIPYLGEFPNYLAYFLQTCHYNKNIDFLFFCDKSFPGVTGGTSNVYAHDMTLAEFNEMAGLKLGRNVQAPNAYKICDFRPMFGKIFADYLDGYEFWGFCDIDVIFGNTSEVLTAEVLENYDVISAHSQYLSGPFSLFRNTKEVNELYSKSADAELVMTRPAYSKFDEASNALPHLWAGGDIADFKAEIESMTHVLKNPQKCALRVRFAGFITERVTGELTWQNGILRDQNGKEVFVFHYIVYKNRFDFGVVGSEFKPGQPFYFYQSGLHTGAVLHKTWYRLGHFAQNFSRRAIKKIRSYAKKK